MYSADFGTCVPSSGIYLPLHPVVFQTMSDELRTVACVPCHPDKLANTLHGFVELIVYHGTKRCMTAYILQCSQTQTIVAKHRVSGSKAYHLVSGVSTLLTQTHTMIYVSFDKTQTQSSSPCQTNVLNKSSFTATSWPHVSDKVFGPRFHILLIANQTTMGINVLHMCNKT